MCVCVGLPLCVYACVWIKLHSIKYYVILNSIFAHDMRSMHATASSYYRLVFYFPYKHIPSIQTVEFLFFFFLFREIGKITQNVVKISRIIK